MMLTWFAGFICGVVAGVLLIATAPFWFHAVMHLLGRCMHLSILIQIVSRKDDDDDDDDDGDPVPHAA